MVDWGFSGVAELKRENSNAEALRARRRRARLRGETEARRDGRAGQAPPLQRHFDRSTLMFSNMGVVRIDLMYRSAI
jgi:hypothetical protein